MSHHTESPLRVLIVGTRSRGLDHLRVLRQMESHFEILGICEPDGDLAERASREFGCARFSRLEETLDRTSPDLAGLCVHGDLNHLFIANLARRGVHALVETPAAPTLPMIDLLTEFAREGGIRVEVAENIYRRPLERFQAQVVLSGKLGPVHRIHNFRRHTGTHAASLLRRIAALPPRQVSAFAGRFSLPFPEGSGIEDWEQARIVMGDAIVACSEHLSPARHPARTPPFLAIECALGTVVDDRFREGGNEYIAQRIEEEEGRLAEIRIAEWDLRWRNPYRELNLHGDDDLAIADEWLSLHRAVTTGSEPEYGLAEARKDIELLTAIWESGALQSTVHLPMAAQTEYAERHHRRFERRYGRQPLETNYLEVPLEDWH